MRPSVFRTVQANTSRGATQQVAAEVGEQRAQATIAAARHQLTAVSSPTSSSSSALRGSSTSGGQGRPSSAQAPGLGATAIDLTAKEREGNNGKPTSGPVGGGREPARESRKRKSSAPVRKYFVARDTEDGEVLVCQPCEKRSKRTHYSANISTGHLRTHMEKEHPEMENPQASSARQRTVEECFTGVKAVEKRAAIPMTRERRQRIKESFVNWVVAGYQALSVAEKKEFIVLANDLDPNWEPPTRNTTRSWVIARWEKRQAEIIRFIKEKTEGRRVAASLDAWGGPTGRGYLGVHLHFLDDEFNLWCIMLAFIRVKHPHTAPEYSSALLEAVVDIDVGLLTKILAITADNHEVNPCMIRDFASKVAELMGQLQNDEEVDAAAVPQLRAARPPAVEAGDAEDNGDEWLFDMYNYQRCLSHIMHLGVKAGRTACYAFDCAAGTWARVWKGERASYMYECENEWMN
eukprot:GHVU01234128.1.p1 GENE.GHVU01234128.1~~GHVU01234128.1.p1  ORF type:complete len:464 (+),score=63.97 GHVU01234128.1:650-2041(+)